MDLLLLPLLFGVVYFVMIRPQQKRQQEMAKMLSGIEVGDDVITIGGLHGNVAEVGDDYLDLQVTADGTLLRFRRDAIAKVVHDEDDTDDSLDSEDSTPEVDEAPATLEGAPIQDAVPSDDLSGGEQRA